jgi:hypothetical protein
MVSHRGERLSQQRVELTTLIRELRPPGRNKTLDAALQEYVTQWVRQNGIPRI